MVIVFNCLTNNRLFGQGFGHLSDSITVTKKMVVVVNRPVMIEGYFQYLDSIIKKYDTDNKYGLTEHLLIRANPWIIDTLKATDYYIMKSRDSFVYDQKKMIVLNKGDTIKIPDSTSVKRLLNAFDKTIIDINIPEFRLRVIENLEVLHEFPVRVGRNEKKYLAMSDRVQDLRTKSGIGKVYAHFKYPKYINPVNNHEYLVTKRDDNRVTALPQIPFIETQVNGLRNGQLIHPTTNPVTLGKAYSNGCIGTKESDAWTIYYHAPIGTRVIIRYDLKVPVKNGDTLTLKDIYYKKS